MLYLCLYSPGGILSLSSPGGAPAPTLAGPLGGLHQRCLHLSYSQVQRSFMWQIIIDGGEEDGASALWWSWAILQLNSYSRVKFRLTEVHRFYWKPEIIWLDQAFHEISITFCWKLFVKIRSPYKSSRLKLKPFFQPDQPVEPWRTPFHPASHPGKPFCIGLFHLNILDSSYLNLILLSTANPTYKHFSKFYKHFTLPAIRVSFHSAPPYYPTNILWNPSSPPHLNRILFFNHKDWP